MREKSEQLRNEIAELQASAKTIRQEAKILIERSQEIVKEIEKRTSAAGSHRPINVA